MIYIQLKCTQASQQVIGYYVQLRNANGYNAFESRIGYNNFIVSASPRNVLNCQAQNEVIYNAKYNKYVMTGKTENEFESGIIQNDKTNIETESLQKTNKSIPIFTKPIGNGFYAQVYSRVTAVGEKLQSNTLIEKVKYFFV